MKKRTLIIFSIYYIVGVFIFLNSCTTLPDASFKNEVEEKADNIQSDDVVISEKTSNPTLKKEDSEPTDSTNIDNNKEKDLLFEKTEQLEIIEIPASHIEETTPVNFSDVQAELNSSEIINLTSPSENMQAGEDKEKDDIPEIKNEDVLPQNKIESVVFSSSLKDSPPLEIILPFEEDNEEIEQILENEAKTEEAVNEKLEKKEVKNENKDTEQKNELNISQPQAVPVQKMTIPLIPLQPAIKKEELKTDITLDAVDQVEESSHIHGITNNFDSDSFVLNDNIEYKKDSNDTFSSFTDSVLQQSFEVKKNDNELYAEEVEPSDVNDEMLNYNVEEDTKFEAEYSFAEFPSTEPDETKQNEASRAIKLYKGQRLEVLYPAEGWVYLGESTAQKGLKYQQRKLENGNTIFHFMSLEEGSYIINFSYFDVFSDDFIADSILVKVDSSKEKMTNTVKAPKYKNAALKETHKNIEDEVKEDKVPPSSSAYTSKAPIPLEKANVGSKSFKKEEKKENLSSVTDLSDMLTLADEEKTESKVKLSSAEILAEIENLIAQGKINEAVQNLDLFFKSYTERLDEAWFLRGKAYEVNGVHKNIKAALEAYKTITSAYPDSKFWDKADERIRYIKRFYINIR